MIQQTIAILMATYNGEQYVSEQLNSILSQTYSKWNLFMHDDGSNDGTLAILKSYAEKYPQQLTLLEYPAQGGPFRNFMSMLEKVESDYYMFCDQDDIWHNDKIEKSMDFMSKMEQDKKNLPIIVHTDLRVVDENGKVIASSFWQQAGMHTDIFHTFSQRISNVVTGCTMLFNKPARNAALSRMPDGSPLHDEWVTIRACAEGGKVYPVSYQLVDYRQHADNTLGAEACYNRKTLGYYLTSLGRIFKENRDNYRVLRSAGYGSPMVYLFNKLRNIVVYHLNY